MCPLESQIITPLLEVELSRLEAPSTWTLWKPGGGRDQCVTWQPCCWTVWVRGTGGGSSRSGVHIMWPSQLLRQFKKVKVQVETLRPNYGKRCGISTFLQRFAFLHGRHVWMRCLQCRILGLEGSAQKPSVPYVINALKILRMPSLITIRLGPFGVCGQANLPFLKTDK